MNGKALEENEAIREEIRSAIGGGMPCLAECGGFMYLHEQMEGMDGKLYKIRSRWTPKEYMQNSMLYGEEQK